MDNNPDFSVLMSLYAGEKDGYFREALSSIQAQVLRPSEVVLVLDGPISAELKDVISEFSDLLPFKIVSIAHNQGLANALSVGLIECSYDLVIRADTDDINLPYRFNNLVSYMVNNLETDICGSLAINMDMDSKELDYRIVPTTHTLIKRLIWSCPLIHPSVIVRRDKILAVGNYNKNLPLRQEDYELWIRAARSGLHFYNLPLYLVKYRISNKAATKNTFSIGYNRFKIGYQAVREFDNRFLSYIALSFPMIRAFCPKSLRTILIKMASLFDPRKTGY